MSWSGWLVFLFALLVFFLYFVEGWKSAFHAWRVRRYYTQWPEVGDLVTYNFTSPLARSPVLKRVDRDGIRIVTWNIEMGYQLDGLAEQLVALNPDIVLIQECDHCVDLLAGTVDVCEYLAQELCFHAIFTPHYRYEFSDGGGGAWGCAILSRYSIESPTFLQLRLINDYDRSALTAIVNTPQGRLLVTSCHLEVCCSIEDRMTHFNAIVDHVYYRQKVEGIVQAVIAGDLNTIAHGLVRLSPFHSQGTRFSNLGRTEAQVWADGYFTHGASDFSDPFNKTRDTTYASALVTAKLDWLLVQDTLEVSHTDVGMANGPSDHQYLVADIHMSR